MQNVNYKNWHYQHAETWKIMPSPARPSVGETAVFQKYLHNYQKGKQKRIKVLILGSTPEFRDMCNKEWFEVTCMDINQPIYHALTLLQRNPNINERFINANWLTFKNKEKYDVILGDNVTGMFSLDHYPQFFRNMNLHLVHNGLLILRVPYQDSRFNVNPEKVIENYRKMKKAKKIHIYTATYNYFAMYFFDKQKSGISLSFLYEKIKDLYQNKKLLKQEFEELELYYKNLTLELFFPKEEYVLSSTKKYFHFLAKEFSLDYLSSYSNPIFILTKMDLTAYG